MGAGRGTARRGTFQRPSASQRSHIVERVRNGMQLDAGSRESGEREEDVCASYH